MLAEVSALLAWLGIGAAAYGACAAAVCLCGGRAAWGESAHRATLPRLRCWAAWLGLLAAFVADRFEVIYVAAHSGRACALLRIAAVWGRPGGLSADLGPCFRPGGRPGSAGQAGRFGLWAIWALDFVTFFFAAATMSFQSFHPIHALVHGWGGLNPLLRHVGMLCILRRCSLATWPWPCPLRWLWRASLPVKRRIGVRRHVRGCWRPGSFWGWACCSARVGPTMCSAGAAIGAGTRWRMPR